MSQNMQQTQPSEITINLKFSDEEIERIFNKCMDFYLARKNKEAIKAALEHIEAQELKIKLMSFGKSE